MKPIIFKKIILFENEDYIVVNKPAHFSTLQDRSPEGKQNLINLAREYCNTAQVAHRLDKETSGILAIAKNPEAYRHIAMQFEHRQVAKIYHAVVQGLQDLDNIAVNLPILPLNKGNVRIDVQAGKEALTFFKTLELFRENTLVECRPITGRMHQIRIHLAVLKASIVADKLYGGTDIYLSHLKRNFNLKKDTEELPLMNRVALHAHSLQFQGLDGQKIRVEATYPKDFQALLLQLRKFT